jgi:signal transduction histidine kinase/DNA-binding response OmpR family regulator/ligand-binding sensor domain-containing protein
MRTFILFLSIVILTRSLAQEHVVFSPINSTHGLSDNRVRTICQLADGRMVIITEGLVNLYDGAGFHTMRYDERQAYPLNQYAGYHRAYVDNENRLWIKNRYNLMLFDIANERFVPNIDSVFQKEGIKGQVNNLFMDNDLNLWLVNTNNELIIRDSQTKQTRIYLKDLIQASPFNHDQLYDVTIRDKQLFLCFKSGEMICYEKDTSKEIYRENPFGERNVNYANTLQVVAHKQFLYQARNGINKGQLIRFNTFNRKWERILETDYWLNTLTIDPEGTCWISSFSGLWKIDENLNHKQLLSPLHLVDGHRFESEISTQFNDNQGGLWVGTVNRGVLYYHPDRFKFRNYGSSLFKPSKPESISIFSLTEHQGKVLVGTQSGVFHHQTARFTIEHLNNIPPHTFCEMLFTDSQNRLWVCTLNNGILCVDGDRTIHHKIPYHCIYMHEAFDGRLFLCTHQGPGIFDAPTGKFHPASGAQLHYAYQLTQYRQDTLLGYSNDGLFFYNIRNNSVSLPDKHAPIKQHKNQHYHCLYTDSRGLIWMGTWDGLIAHNPTTQTTQTFYTEDGLVNNSIRSIIEDDRGRIWVSTSNGISCIEITASGGKDTFRFSNYNHYDGLIQNEYMPRSVYKTKDGRLLWGGLDGFNEMDIHSMNKPEPRLYLPLFTRFSIAGTEVKMGENHDGNIILEQSITSTKTIRLKHHQNFIGVEFSALNYVNPTQTTYRYRLNGVDSEWREIKTNDGIGRAGYTNLSPGTYQLKVQATNHNQWDNRVAQLTIIIAPPFWKTGWAYVSYLIFIIGLIYAIISYSIRHNIQKNKRLQKEELDQLKFRFFTNISHELRTPLTLIITPLDSLIKKLNDDTIKTQLTGISRNAHELLNLVNQLLAFRKLEMNGETLNLGYCNLCEFIDTIVPPFNDLARENEVRFEFIRPKTDLFLYADQDKLRKIVNNLLSNAFKFTPQGGQIQMTIEKNETTRQVLIHVSDNGCGIAQNEQTQIFDRFYQAKNQQNQTGSGIGLHLVKEYAQLHNGSASVESHPGEGSVFTVTLSTDLKPQNQSGCSDILQDNNTRLKLLVVDDHTEFRNFLLNELSEKYSVIVAANGQEGLQKAREEQPDLIVSDVMMPLMNGTELCRHLKTDLNTSHIPIILLTAKTSDEAQLEGFEAGADAYLPKPFNMDILLLRIDHLIEQQAKRKELFKNNIVITPASIATSTVDEELIKKVLSHIEANMDNGNYSVEQLSKDMYMDRTGLYRKLTAITGQTPTEFMRTVRLKKAAQLLQQGHSVSEVTESVGFGSGSYFTKCFQEEFGVKPSQYKNQQ